MLLNASILASSRQNDWLRRLRVIKAALAAALLFGANAYVHAGTIASCEVGDSGPGASLISTCGPGFVYLTKTFTETPSFLDVRINLQPTADGLPTIIAPVIELVENKSDKDWTDFHISSPDASLLAATSMFSGFSSCVNLAQTEIFCDGGPGVPSGGSFFIFFDLGTPVDQNLDFFTIHQEPSFAVSEPASLAIVGFGLVLLGCGVNRGKTSTPGTR